MNSISDTFWAPVKQPLTDGSEVTFHPLDMDDLSSWCEEIHGIKRKAEAALIPAGIGALDLFRIRRTIDLNKPTLDDIGDMMYQPSGIRTCLIKSLMKGGMKNDEARSSLKKMKPNEQQSMARRMSGLFDPMVPPTPDNLTNKSAPVTQDQSDFETMTNGDKEPKGLEGEVTGSEIPPSGSADTGTNG